MGMTWAVITVIFCEAFTGQTQKQCVDIVFDTCHKYYYNYQGVRPIQRPDLCAEDLKIRFEKEKSSESKK